MSEVLYSVRMRAAQGGPHELGGHHISGAECIVTLDKVGEMAQSFANRALHHSKGEPDFINIVVDMIPETTLQYIPYVSIEEHYTADIKESHELAISLLHKSPISLMAIHKAFQYLQDLPCSMRGAMLVDSITGERLDVGDRGVRVSHMDSIDNERIGCNTHMKEALVLASKVQSCEGILGELCWSDDPDYTVGYVSFCGVYHRIPHMKAIGSDIGGRVFFIDKNARLETIIEYLENTPVIVRK